VCGRSGGKVVAAGAYLTAVNVHNPHDTEVRFSAKVALALPGFTPGPVSPKRDAALGPDEALEVDCPDIRRLAPTKDKFLKGFLVLESARELDVVAVYTVAAADGEFRTLEIERVPARTSRATA
jgi:hypothetical protein